MGQTECCVRTKADVELPSAVDGRPASHVESGRPSLRLSAAAASAEEEIRKEFKNADANGDGRISRSELSRVVLASYDLGQQELDAMFSVMDQNSDGTIIYDEFVKFMFAAYASPAEKQSAIGDGTPCVVMHKGILWASASEWTQLGQIFAGQQLVAAGKPEIVQAYCMVPIRPKGAVEMDLLSLVPEKANEHEHFIQAGTTCVIESKGVVWASVSSWWHTREMVAGERVVAAGPPVNASGYMMVPITPSGAVEMDLLSVAPEADQEHVLVKVQGAGKASGLFVRTGELNGHSCYAMPADNLQNPQYILCYAGIAGTGDRSRNTSEIGWVMIDGDFPGSVTRSYLYKNLTKRASEPWDCVAVWLSPTGSPRKDMVVQLVEHFDTDEAFQAWMAQREDFADDSDWEDDVDENAPWLDIGGADDDERDDSSFGDTQEAPVEQRLFEDPDFPAAPSSIGTVQGDTASGLSSVRIEGWDRLPKLAAMGPKLNPFLFNHIRPNDVVQGSLGYCWLLASCAAVASYPAQLRKIFGTMEDLNDLGRYQVRIYHPGRKAYVKVAVDDRVPVQEGWSGWPAYAQISADGEVWPCLIEKAFAKLSGSYACLEGGFPAFGLMYLCGGQGEMWGKNTRDWEWEGLPPKGPGGPWSRLMCNWTGGLDDAWDRIKYEQWESVDEGGFDRVGLWSVLKAYCSKNYPMACGVASERANMQGLVCGHAYSLISVREVRSGSRILKLVKVRNPHGHTEWTGRWGDSSHLWSKHPSVRKHLEFKRRDDGTFWMSMKDFLEYFEVLAVVKKGMALQGAHPDKLKENAGAA